MADALAAIRDEHVGSSLALGVFIVSPFDCNGDRLRSRDLFPEIGTDA